ncbi:condensation domain-containing protein, partial [Virgisporangium aurantiacum]|uniref:condensation domain-containing protein n=1 Tax=Virgisporangium aurantiacum TaxID=175570 RepID=UPI001EF326FB
PFDVESGPLVRGSVFRLTDVDHVLCVVMHHVVADEWSVRIFQRELSTLYRAFAAGLASPLPPLPIQYADFAVWQRNRLQGPVLDRLLDYWTRQLADLTPAQLPTDRPRPATPTGAGDMITTSLPAPVADHLRTLAHQHQVTVFMALLAAFQLVLARWTGQRDIAVAIPVADRSRPETHTLIGFFVNTLIIRTHITPTTTFAELLTQVRTTVLEAFAHQDLPFERLVEALAPHRDRTRNPLTPIVYNHETPTPHNPNTTTTSTDGTGWDLPDIHTTTYPLPCPHSKFDLTLNTTDHGPATNLTITTEYATQLFNHTTIQ